MDSPGIKLGGDKTTKANFVWSLDVHSKSEIIKKHDRAFLFVAKL
jgi:hypothetical protein